MAWTEQCKFAFRTSATAKLGRFKNKNRKVNGVLRELSRESDIPFNTLKRWYYDKEDDSISIKNDTDKPKPSEKSEYLTRLSEDLSEHFGTKVTIKKRGQKGKIEIEFYNNDDLDRLIARLEQK